MLLPRTLLLVGVLDMWLAHPRVGVAATPGDGGDAGSWLGSTMGSRLDVGSTQSCPHLVGETLRVRLDHGDGEVKRRASTPYPARQMLENGFPVEGKSHSSKCLQGAETHDQSTLR